MYCKPCGKELAAKVNFCPVCFEKTALRAVSEKGTVKVILRFPLSHM